MTFSYRLVPCSTNKAILGFHGFKSFKNNIIEDEYPDPDNPWSDIFCVNAGLKNYLPVSNFTSRCKPFLISLQ